MGTSGDLPRDPRRGREKYFYPELLRLGTGGADADSVDEEVEDAVEDHNEIRQALRAAEDHEVGSDGWWTAVVDANVHNSDHMGEEERQDLADFRQQASLELRHEIAPRFVRYQWHKAAGGIEPVDKDPQEYVAGRADGPETGSEKRAKKLAEAAAAGHPTTGAGETKTSSKEPDPSG